MLRPRADRSVELGIVGCDKEVVGTSLPGDHYGPWGDRDKHQFPRAYVTETCIYKLGTPPADL